jgi:O-acetyl-ADP-ribose deacetylase (regulator of RNase III)
MIRYASGNLLHSKAALIGHGVAPNDNFAQGLALALRENWPALYKDFRHYCQTSHPKAGDCWVWAGASGQRIANLLTQEAAYGHGSRPGKATLANVNHALRALHKFIDTEQIGSIALPRLATGVGGLDWKDVKPLLEHHLGSLDADIEVYESYVPATHDV